MLNFMQTDRDSRCRVNASAAPLGALGKPFDACLAGPLILRESSALLVLGWQGSAEIAEEDSVAVDFAPGQEQTFAIEGPSEIEDQAGGEFGYLLWFSA